MAATVSGECTSVTSFCRVTRDDLEAGEAVSVDELVSQRLRVRDVLDTIERFERAISQSRDVTTRRDVTARRRTASLPRHYTNPGLDVSPDAGKPVPAPCDIHTASPGPWTSTPTEQERSVALIRFLQDLQPRNSCNCSCADSTWTELEYSVRDCDSFALARDDDRAASPVQQQSSEGSPAALSDVTSRLRVTPSVSPCSCESCHSPLWRLQMCDLSAPREQLLRAVSSSDAFSRASFRLRPASTTASQRGLAGSLRRSIRNTLRRHRNNLSDSAAGQAFRRPSRPEKPGARSSLRASLRRSLKFTKDRSDSDSVTSSPRFVRTLARGIRSSLRRYCCDKNGDNDTHTEV